MYTCFVSVKGGSSVPQRVLFVEELSDLLTESLPDLWKLGQAYFNGALIADVCLLCFFSYKVYFFSIAGWQLSEA